MSFVKATTTIIYLFHDPDREMHSMNCREAVERHGPMASGSGSNAIAKPERWPQLSDLPVAIVKEKSPISESGSKDHCMGSNRCAAAE